MSLPFSGSIPTPCVHHHRMSEPRRKSPAQRHRLASYHVTSARRPRHVRRRRCRQHADKRRWYCCSLATVIISSCHHVEWRPSPPAFASHAEPLLSFRRYASAAASIMVVAAPVSGVSAGHTAIVCRRHYHVALTFNSPPPRRRLRHRCHVSSLNGAASSVIASSVWRHRRHTGITAAVCHHADHHHQRYRHAATLSR